MYADKKVEFLRKLQSLLSEYDAHIYWTFSACSDLHGVSDEGMGVYLGDEQILNVYGIGISGREIKEGLKDQYKL